MATSAIDKSRVLVVDDEPQITRVLRTVLTSQGYQVRTAAEGEAALTNFTEWRPELVITDLYMPHMDGIELCRRIRAMSNVPISALSVKGEEKTKVEALDSGADDYVTRPVGIDELRARVRAALRRGGGEADIAAFDAGDFRVDLEGRRVPAPPFEIDAEVAGVERRDVGLAAATAQRRADAGAQLVDADRPGHVVVGARVERFDLGLLLALHRQRADRHVRHRANPSAQLDAVHVRHVEIRDHQLGSPLGEIGERRFTLRRGSDLVSLTGEHRPQHARDLRLVVDDEHSRLVDCACCHRPRCYRKSVSHGRVVMDFL